MRSGLQAGTSNTGTILLSSLDFRHWTEETLSVRVSTEVSV